MIKKTVLLYSWVVDALKASRDPVVDFLGSGQLQQHDAQKKRRLPPPPPLPLPPLNPLGVVVVCGAGPLIFSPLQWVPLTVASAAVAVQGAGWSRAGFFSGSLPLCWSAVVAGRRAEEVEDADCNLHVSAFVAVDRIRPPAGEEAVSKVADAASVFSWDHVAGEDELHIAGVESSCELAVEVFEVLHELLSSLHLRLNVPGDVRAVWEIVAACLQEEAGKCAEDQDMPIAARSDQPVEL